MKSLIIDDLFLTYFKVSFRTFQHSFGTFYMLQTVRAKKVDKKMGSFVYSLGDNILELYNVLVQIRLTTSKTKRGIHCCKLDRTS